MTNFVTEKNATIIDISGQVVADSTGETPLLKGAVLQSGAALTFSPDSRMILLLDDGTVQQLQAELQGTDGDIVVAVQDPGSQASDSAGTQQLPQDLQDEIAAIQASIEATGDDTFVSPDTAAGGLTGNEGTDFVTLERDGAETIAGAGFDTGPQDTPADTPANLIILDDLDRPTVTQSDFNTIPEDTTATGNVLTNDSDPDDVLSVVSYTVNGDPTVYLAGQTAPISGGSLTVNGDGSYVFVPAPNFNGVLPVVTYTTNTEATDTLSITVTPVSDLVDADESVTTEEDTAVSGNLLANAASEDGTPQIADFTVNGVTSVAGQTAVLAEGSLTVAVDGSYTFTPAENYNGDVPVVTYTVSDGLNNDVSTLAITVTPVSDLVDGDEAVTTEEDTPISGNLLANGASADGIPQISDFTVNGTTLLAGQATALTEGSLTVAADGSYTFTPADNFNGDVPTVTYTVTDGVNTETSTLSISVTPVSDLTDDDESVTTEEDTPVSGNLLDNGASTDGTPQIRDFTISGTTFAAGQTATIAEGALTVAADGSYTFAPAQDYFGTLPEVAYTVSDGVNTDISTLAIEVTPVSDLADGNEDVTTPENIPVSGNLLANTTGAEGTAQVTNFTVSGVTFDAGQTANLAEGSLTLAANGTYTFVPATDFDGTVPQVTYTVADDTNTATSVLSIDVTPVVVPPPPPPPSPPLSDADESVTTAENIAVSGNLLTNTANPNGTPSVTNFTVGGVTYTAGQVASLTEGTLTVEASGSYTFTPTQDYNGEVPIVTYTVADNANTDTSTLSIRVTPASELTDGDESVTTPESTGVSGNLLQNAFSSDGTPVLASFNVGGTTVVFSDTTTQATVSLIEGTLTLNNVGEYTFAPSEGFSGSVPTVTYTVFDGINTDDSTLTIEVTDVNNPPLAEDDVFSVVEGQSVSGNVITHHDGDLIADSDGGDGGSLFVTQVNGIDLVFDSVTGIAVVDDIEGGELEISANGDFTYTNTDGFDVNSVTPRFTYTLSDGTDTDSAEVTINVTINAPEANPDQNFIELRDSDDSGTAELVRVAGELIQLGSSGDLPDSSVDGFGTPALVSIEFEGQTYTFSDNLFHQIETEYGVLSVLNSGFYQFETHEGLDIPSETIALEFEYVIQDGDSALPDTDSSTLTIHISPPPEASGKTASADFGSSTVDIDVLLDAVEPGQTESADVDGMADNLSEIFALTQNDSIEQYLVASEDGVGTSLDLQSIEQQIELAKSESSDEVVTNGLLAEGGRIVGDDTSVNQVPSHEMDSEVLS